MLMQDNKKQMHINEKNNRRKTSKSVESTIFLYTDIRRIFKLYHIQLDLLILIIIGIRYCKIF